jgi:hypothetical protein
MSKLSVDATGKFIGTTIDSLVQHANGDVTLLDWKTGNLLSDYHSSVIMQYGQSAGVTDTKLNRAHLELVFRALILKEHFPDMRFRDVGIGKLSKNGNHRFLHTDIVPYLKTIGEYYKQNHPDVYKELVDKKLFDPATYYGSKGQVLKALEGSIAFAPIAEQIQYVKGRLEMIYVRNTPEQIEKDPYLRDQVKIYTEALLEFSKLPGTNIDANVEDIPSVTGLLKGFTDIDNPKIQGLHKHILEARSKANKGIRDLTEAHDALAAKVIAEAGSTTVKQLRKAVWWPLAFGVLTANPMVAVSSLVVGLALRRMDKTTKDVFGFMWKKSEDLGRPGYYLNLSDTHNGTPLTKTQKEYRDFYKKRMHEEYARIMSQVVAFTDYGTPLTRAQVANKPAKLEDDFMPRIPPTLVEIREDENFFTGWMGLHTQLKYWARKNLTDFVQNTSNYDERDPIPVKYMAHTGDTNVEKGLHSFDPTRGFVMFLGSLVHKEHFEELYPLAQGLLSTLKSETTPEGKEKFKNLTSWLDKQISLQITQTKPKER